MCVVHWDRVQPSLGASIDYHRSRAVIMKESPPIVFCDPIHTFRSPMYSVEWFSQERASAAIRWFGAASRRFLMIDHGLSESGSLNICHLFVFCSLILLYKILKNQPRSSDRIW